MLNLLLREILLELTQLGALLCIQNCAIVCLVAQADGALFDKLLTALHVAQLALMFLIHDRISALACLHNLLISVEAYWRPRLGNLIVAAMFHFLGI